MSEEIHDAELVEDDDFLQGEKVGFSSQTNIGKMVALGLVALLLSSTILYTILSDDDEKTTSAENEIAAADSSIFVTDGTGASIDVDPIDMTFFASSVGEDAAEPSIGITSTGCVFFIAFEKVMRSCDYGETWEAKQDPVACSPTTSDPYGWVDPITDRVFGVQMIGLETSWICWSDDDG